MYKILHGQLGWYLIQYSNIFYIYMGVLNIKKAAILLAAFIFLIFRIFNPDLCGEKNSVMRLASRKKLSKSGMRSHLL